MGTVLSDRRSRSKGCLCLPGALLQFVWPQAPLCPLRLRESANDRTLFQWEEEQTELPEGSGDLLQVTEELGRIGRGTDVDVYASGGYAEGRERTNKALETVEDTTRGITADSGRKISAKLDFDEGNLLTTREQDPGSAIQPVRFRLLTHNSYPSTTLFGEVFVRYSAIKGDKRIMPDGSVRSGTYVTTMADRPKSRSIRACRCRPVCLA